MTQIFAALAAGGAAVAGQYLGMEKADTAKRTGNHLIVLLIALSLGIATLLYALNFPILHGLFGKVEKDVMDAATKYYLIVMASIPAIALYNGGTAMFRAMGRTDMTLKIATLMNIINVGGNALLIFGFNMKVEGVAIPTLASRWIAAGVIIGLLMNKKYFLNLREHLKFKYDKVIMKNIVRLGIPSGIENGMFQFGKIALYSFVSTLGTASITAHAIAGNIISFHTLTGFAINLGITTVVSQCVGAGKFEMAKKYYRKFMLWTHIGNFATAILMTSLLPLIMAIYDVSPEATRYASIILFMHATSGFILWPVSFVTPAFLRSTGDATFTMIVGALSMWIFRVGAGILIANVFDIGIIGVWVAHTVVDWLVRGICFFIRYKSGKWKTKAIKA